MYENIKFINIIICHQCYFEKRSGGKNKFIWGNIRRDTKNLRQMAVKKDEECNVT